ncbi:MAG: porin [Alphaproteobacteria bacterium]
MINYKTLLLSSALILVCNTSAFADAKDDRIAAMEAQMKVMMQEIETLKAERAAEKTEQAQIKQKISAIETKTEAAVAAISPAAGQDDDVKISMKGSTPKISKGEFSWQPTGRIHLDAGSISDDKRDHPNGAEFRRARLGMQGQITDDFGYKAEVDFANENVAIKDMYMNYTGVKNTEIRIGHFKPGYSLDDMTSSNDITFIERSAAIEPFSLSEQIGAGIINHGDNHHIAVGVFNDDAGKQSTDDEQFSTSARIAGTPYKKDKNLVHLGGSVSYREPDQANDRFDYDSFAENRLQTTDSVSSVINDGENSTIYGVEAAAVSGPLSVQGEYVMADIENRAGQNPTYTGAYGQVAWTVTGETRPYSIAKGAFGGIKPDHPLNPKDNGWGALELAARYSHLDLNDGGLNGGEMDTLTLGANWYLNNYMRLMGNIIFVDTDDNATTSDDDPTIFLTRSQVKF